MSYSHADRIGPDEVVPYRGSTPFKRVRLRHRGLLNRVLRNLETHQYTAILAPPMWEKSQFLQDVAEALEKGDLPGRLPIKVDLRKVRTDSAEAFYRDLVAQIAAHTPAQPIFDPPDTVADFLSYLRRLPDRVRRHVVLLVDHLPTIVPQALLREFLGCLRTLHQEGGHWPWQLSVVIAGGMGLFPHTQGSTSPFNIARIVVIPPLSREQGERLVRAHLEGFRITDNALARLLEVAGGHRYLLPRLCAHCQDVVAGYSDPTRIIQTVVDQAVKRLPSDVYGRLPVEEAVRILEEDVDTVLDMVDLLHHGLLEARQARQLPGPGGTNRLVLSGAVCWEGDSYRFLNAYMRDQLAARFTPSHVARILRVAGRWQGVLRYLCTVPLAGRAEGEADPEALQREAEMQEAVVQHIYALDDPDKAFRVLAEGLEAIFLPAIRRQLQAAEAGPGEEEPLAILYRYVAGQRCLVRVAPNQAPPHWPDQIPLHESQRAVVEIFRDGHYAFPKGPRGRLLVMSIEGEVRPIGVLVIDPIPTTPTGRVDLRSMPELNRFLRHASQALEQVIRRQALRRMGRRILEPGTGDGDNSAYLVGVLQDTVAGLGAENAALYLWSPGERTLRLQALADPYAEMVASLSAEIPESNEDNSLMQAFRQALKAPDQGSLSDDTPLAKIRVGDWICWAIPLRAQKEPVGLLVLWYRVDHPPPDIHRRYRADHPQSASSRYEQALWAFVDNVAIALLNYRLLAQTSQELRRRVEELEAIRARLEAGRREEMADLVRMWVHRLGNDLGDIPFHLGYVRQALSGQPSLWEQTGPSLDHVQRRIESLRHLSRTMGSWLNDAEKSSIHLVNLRQVILTARRRASQQFHPEIDWQVAPETLPELFVRADAKVLEEVVYCLLENAAQALDGPGWVRVSLERIGERAILRVADSGPGVPAELAARIFEPGFSTKLSDNRSGQGMGLYLARIMVALYRGELELERPGREGEWGAVFVIRLPVLSTGP